MDKKVLIITYYWPPSGGSGVQRWLKFVKYLPSFGWEPYVFTPENPTFSLRDESLLKDIPPEAEVIRFPIWEPYSVFFSLSRLAGKKTAANPAEIMGGKKKSFLQWMSTWIRGNFFIPDPRVFWVKPSARFLGDFIRENKIKTIITTGPPHSVHLIGYRLKKKYPSLRWIADFRDPWTHWGFLDTLMVSSIARRVHKRLESKVLSAADKIITITPFYVRQFKSLAQRQVTLLTNGYDDDDFKHMKLIRSEKFLIRHVGIVNEKCDPQPFMNALKELMHEQDTFRSNLSIEFIGEVHPWFRSFVKEDTSLQAVTIFTGSVPHEQLISLYGESSLLLLILTGYKDAGGYMPGKLFEYLATRLPIIGTGPPDGDAAALLQETGAGEMVEGMEKERIKQLLWNHFERWREEEHPVLNSKIPEQYSRRSLTRELTELL